jgi:hypothetical protein
MDVCRDATEDESKVPRILHLVAAVTDEVYSFLGPALRELSYMGRPQSIVLLDDEKARKHIHHLQRHAEVVLVEKNRNKYVQYKDFYLLCCRELLRSRPTTLHFHGIVPCVIGSLALRRCGLQAKVLYSPHGSRSLSTLRLAGWLTMALARPLIRPAQSSAIATFALQSKAFESWGSSHLIESPVHDAFLNVPRAESAHPLVLSGGTYASIQAIEILSQIAVLLSAEELSIGFKWLGHMDKHMVRCFDAAGVRIVDIERDSTHAAELAAGWLYVAPWRTRGYPLFLIQAMAVGLPSVVMDTPQHRQVIEHGTTGFLCATEDEMVRAIALLIDDAGLRARMGDAARDATRARFGSLKFRSRLMNSYSSDLFGE